MWCSLERGSRKRRAPAGEHAPWWDRDSVARHGETKAHDHGTQVADMQSHSGQRPETLKAPRKIGAIIDDDDAGGDEKPATADNSSIQQAWKDKAHSSPLAMDSRRHL